MKKVVIESPLSGDFARNLRYARLCALDCINRGEAPYASHLLMTQFLDDRNPEHRKLGMEAGFAWGEAADLVVVYRDLGISAGMKLGIDRAEASGKPFAFRRLPADLLARLDDGPPAQTPGMGGRPVVVVCASCGGLAYSSPCDACAQGASPDDSGGATC